MESYSFANFCGSGLMSMVNIIFKRKKIRFTLLIHLQSSKNLTAGNDFSICFQNIVFRWIPFVYFFSIGPCWLFTLLQMKNAQKLYKIKLYIKIVCNKILKLIYHFYN